MATEKTPFHKRLTRAEKAQDEWKMKAIERREEGEKLKIEVRRKNERIETLEKSLKYLQKELNRSKDKNEKQEEVIGDLKKKSLKKG